LTLLLIEQVDYAKVYSDGKVSIKIAVVSKSCVGLKLTYIFVSSNTLVLSIAVKVGAANAPATGVNVIPEDTAAIALLDESLIVAEKLSVT
jgi:hypothetical protein